MHAPRRAVTTYTSLIRSSVMVAPRPLPSAAAHPAASTWRSLAAQRFVPPQPQRARSRPKERGAPAAFVPRPRTLSPAPRPSSCGPAARPSARPAAACAAARRPSMPTDPQMRISVERAKTSDASATASRTARRTSSAERTAHSRAAASVGRAESTRIAPWPSTEPRPTATTPRAAASTPGPRLKKPMSAVGRAGVLPTSKPDRPLAEATRSRRPLPLPNPRAVVAAQEDITVTHECGTGLCSCSVACYFPPGYERQRGAEPARSAQTADRPGMSSYGRMELANAPRAASADDRLARVDGAATPSGAATAGDFPCDAAPGSDFSTFRWSDTSDASATPQSTSVNASKGSNSSGWSATSSRLSLTPGATDELKRRSRLSRRLGPWRASPE